MRSLEQREQRMVASARMLESLSPLPTLARGYTVLRDPTGAVISRTAELAVGQEVYGQMLDGRFTAKILDTNPGNLLNDVQLPPTEEK